MLKTLAGSDAPAIQITISADVLTQALAQAFAQNVAPPVQQAPLPRFLSVAEFAETLGISDAAVGQYCRRGKIKGVRLGARWCIPATEFDRLIEVGGICGEMTNG